MGAPIPEMEPVENASAEALLSSLKSIDPGERRKHASVFNYWLSIRGNRQFPPIRDLDPLEISDAGPWSLLLEMIGGGEDAVVRHFGQSIKGNLQVEKIGEAPNPSLLSCIHAKLPIVAACREAFAFEEEFETDAGTTRCWVTLLPFSATGAWIDFVYGYVSLDGAAQASEEMPEAVEQPEAAETVEVAEAAEEPAEDTPEIAEQPFEEEPSAEENPEPFKVPLAPLDGEPDAMDAQASPVEETTEPDPVVEFATEPEEAEPVVGFAEEEQSVEEATEQVTEDAPDDEPVAECEPESTPEPDQASASKPSFSSKILGGLASSFYGKTSQSGAADYPETPAEAPVEPAAETEPDAAGEAELQPEAADEETVEPESEVASEEPVEALDEPSETIAEPACEVEGTLQSKLSDVRALAEEAREAQVRSNMALYEGLSAAYDFALDAESEPEQYLKLVEAQGLKIQLRSPMKPVVKLAFDGMCDEPTIKQLEAVLAWALKQDLPRGTLAERIQEEGGIGQILNGKAS